MLPVAATASDRGSPGASTLLSAGRYRIALDSPIPDLATAQVGAYRAIDPAATDRQLVGLITAPSAPPRQDMVEALRTLNHPNVLHMVASHPVERAADGQPRFALIYDRPLGGRVIPRDGGRTAPMGESELIDRILRPVLTGLTTLHERGIAHRGVRPDNLFFFDADRRILVLGDGAAAPPGCQQPVSFEPIERALCHPMGRGAGTRACDIFALGTLVLSLLTGSQPKDTPELMAARLEHGSYTALVGKLSLPSVFRDLLRGLLSDDPEERWTAADIFAWADAGRSTPRRGGNVRRVVMPYQFAGRAHTSRTALAAALAQDRRAAAAEIETTRISTWLLNSAGDADAAKRLANLVAGARGDSKGRDLLVTRACAMLDPAGPLRLDGLTVMVDGIGPLLAHAVARDDRALVTNLSRVIAQGLPVDWAELNGGARGPHMILQRHFQHLQVVVKGRGIGQGIERCLYELNPLAACASAQLDGLYVMDPAGLLRGLERSAATDVGEPIDRHVAGMLGARLGAGEERILVDLASSDAVERALASLRLLAQVQSKLDLPVPALTKRMYGWLAPVRRALRSKTLRERAEQEIKKAIEAGSLVAMSNALSPAQLWKRDRSGHQAAGEAWRQAQEGITTLMAGANARLRHAHAVGQRLAAGAAWIGLMVVVTVVLVR